MARRDLAGVAVALADQFRSRNNDIGGYWGVGVLFLAANRQHLGAITLNLLEPADELSSRYGCELRRHLTAGGNMSLVEQAHLTVRFDSNPPNACVLPESPRRWCEFSVRLLADTGREFRSLTWVECAPHDPEHERRSVGWDQRWPVPIADYNVEPA